VIRNWYRTFLDTGTLAQWVNRRLWLDMLPAATAASALMAVVAGTLVLSQSAQEQRRQAEGLQRQLSVGLTSYEPMYNLQRRLQQVASSQEVESALVVDQRGLVLAASNKALVGLPLPQVLQLPNQHHLRELFADCPSASTLHACLTREEVVFHGPLPWIGGDALLAIRQYPLALEGVDRYGDRASLITITDVRQSGNEAILFVLKLFLAGLLPLFVGCAGLMVQLRRELIPQLLHLAQIDSLSGIYNRRAFTEAATDVLKRARQAGLPISFALIDVDHFKQINDSYGHDAGDKVIRQVAELLRAALRGNDLVGRLGGDEFAILMQLPATEASHVLERTRQKIQATPIASGDGQDVQVDLSVGLATSDGRAGYGLSELMGAADAALYVAKDRGRGQLVNLETDSRATRSRHSAELGYWQVGGL
jgi:diguanylate cyclase (GGDEF)-like protein